MKAPEMVPAEYAWRVDRARALMAREACDLMILDSGESLAWISGYTVSETMYRAAFLPRDGAPWFVLRELDEAPCREGGWITDVAGYPDTASPEEFMVDELRRRGFAGATIGVDHNSISFNPARAAAFAAALPDARFVNLMGATDSLRWVKSAHEIAQIAAAAAHRRQRDGAGRGRRSSRLHHPRGGGYCRRCLPARRRRHRRDRTHRARQRQP